MTYYDSLSVAKDDALGSGSSVFSSATQDIISVLEPGGPLRFFWLDYLEHGGKVHFIGKLKDKKSGVWVSCCVTIENLRRNPYVLPRKRCIGTETSTKRMLYHKLPTSIRSSTHSERGLG